MNIPTQNWAGKWALITGGAQRIGAVLARHLAACGMNIIIHYFTSADAALALKKELEKRHKVRVKLVSGDLTKKEVVDEIFKKYSPDAVLNNAAVFKPNDTRENMATNRDAPLRITKAAIRRMLADKKKGVIVFYGDAWIGRGRAYPKNLDGYVRSKRWIPGAVANYAPYGRKGIRIVGILNGPIVPPKSASREAVALIAKQLQSPDDERVPWIGPEAVADATKFVLQNSAIVGSCIFVDAGRGATKGRAPKEH